MGSIVDSGNIISIFPVSSLLLSCSLSQRMESSLKGNLSNVGIGSDVFAGKWFMIGYIFANSSLLIDDSTEEKNW